MIPYPASNRIIFLVDKNPPSLSNPPSLTFPSWPGANDLCGVSPHNLNKASEPVLNLQLCDKARSVREFGGEIGKKRVSALINALHMSYQDMYYRVLWLLLFPDGLSKYLSTKKE